jgi:hypothetical protein
MAPDEFVGSTDLERDHPCWPVGLRSSSFENLMFTTHPAFKHPIQLDAKSTTWRAVEIELQTPWFLATVFDSNEDIERTFILSGCDDVLLFAEQAPLGRAGRCSPFGE